MLQCVRMGTHLHRLVHEHRGKDKHSRIPTWLDMHTGLLNVDTHEVRTGMGAHCLRMELREPRQGVSQPPPYPSCTQEKELRTEGFKAGGGSGSLDGRDSQPFWPLGPASAFSEPIPYPLPSPEPLLQQVELLRAGSYPATCCCPLESSLGISAGCQPYPQLQARSHIWWGFGKRMARSGRSAKTGESLAWTQVGWGRRAGFQP